MARVLLLQGRSREFKSLSLHEVVVSKLSLDIGRATENAGVIARDVGASPTHPHAGVPQWQREGA